MFCCSGRIHVLLFWTIHIHVLLFWTHPCSVVLDNSHPCSVVLDASMFCCFGQFTSMFCCSGHIHVLLFWTIHIHVLLLVWAIHIHVLLFWATLGIMSQGDTAIFWAGQGSSAGIKSGSELVRLISCCPARWTGVCSWDIVPRVGNR
jgi:hypothetical protein